MQIDKDREANVTDAAVEALGALVAQLPWVQYEQLLNQWLKVMKKTATKVQATLPALSMATACLMPAYSQLMLYGLKPSARAVREAT